MRRRVFLNLCFPWNLIEFYFQSERIKLKCDKAILNGMSKWNITSVDIFFIIKIIVFDVWNERFKYTNFIKQIMCMLQYKRKKNMFSNKKCRIFEYQYWKMLSMSKLPEQCAKPLNHSMSCTYIMPLKADFYAHKYTHTHILN